MQGSASAGEGQRGQPVGAAALVSSSSAGACRSCLSAELPVRARPSPRRRRPFGGFSSGAAAWPISRARPPTLTRAVPSSALPSVPASFPLKPMSSSSLPRRSYDPLRLFVIPLPAFLSRLSLGPHKRSIGVHLAGALFALGWWCFIDAVIQSGRDARREDSTGPHVNFADWSAGLIATRASSLLLTSSLVGASLVRTRRGRRADAPLRPASPFARVTPSRHAHRQPDRQGPARVRRLRRRVDDGLARAPRPLLRLCAARRRPRRLHRASPFVLPRRCVWFLSSVCLPFCSVRAASTPLDGQRGGRVASPDGAGGRTQPRSARQVIRRRLVRARRRHPAGATPSLQHPPLLPRPSRARLELPTRHPYSAPSCPPDVFPPPTNDCAPR